jgi:replication factor C subunit 3/5
LDQIHERLLHVADEEKVNYSLSGGDMRRVLNLLQTTAMSSEEVNEITVYLTSGAPLPTYVQAISHSLLNDKFVDAQSKITTLCKKKGYAMADILSELTIRVSGMDLPAGALAKILDEMSGVEYRLAFGTDEEIQCASLVGVFVRARAMMTVK